MNSSLPFANFLTDHWLLVITIATTIVFAVYTIILSYHALHYSLYPKRALTLIAIQTALGGFFLLSALLVTLNLS